MISELCYTNNGEIKQNIQVDFLSTLIRIFALNSTYFIKIRDDFCTSNLKRVKFSCDIHLIFQIKVLLFYFKLGI